MEAVDLARYPITDRPRSRFAALASECRRQLDATGAASPGFLTEQAVARMVAEANELSGLAHWSRTRGTPYLEAPNTEFPEGHPRRTVGRSSTGVVAYDQFPAGSLIRGLYESDALLQFVSAALDRSPLYPYADPMGALNLAVMRAGDELPWHFDQTDFVVSLALEPAERGGHFEYVPMVRSATDERYDDVAAVLAGRDPGVITVPMRPGTLLLFEGRHSIHRVTPIEGDTARLVALLAYDTKPDTVSTPALRQARYGREG